MAGQPLHMAYARCQWALTTDATTATVATMPAKKTFAGKCPRADSGVSFSPDSCAYHPTHTLGSRYHQMLERGGISPAVHGLQLGLSRQGTHKGRGVR